ncbi:hypothetical protein F2Q69_00045680 [Brassica cretica]|uniref:Replication factor A C-terminal domain-containing protein n=1 Tax=Brassica cretica TaxID=69181 RepID=A0A8S9NFC3_BRACR|nr:hypothetical protein F2Q69_00045680 [Brassica cretica]
MASSAPAVFAPTSFDDLRLGRSAQFFVARLLRFWNSRNIKKQDHLYLHSTAATKFYFGNNLAAITEFTMSPTGDLSKFLSNSSSQSLITQEAYFTCIAQTVGGVAQKGWYYVSCTQCGKEVGNSATSHPCDQCHDTNATTVVRVELLVDDGENYATFLVLDKEIMKLTKQDAVTLVDDEVNRLLRNRLPKCIAELEGQKFIYHVNVTTNNLTDNGPTFTFSEMSAIPNKEYKVELLVDDGENYATFLVLDKEMMKLTKQDAATLLDDEVNRLLRNRLPKCIAELEGQKFIYHVNVTTDNLTDNGPTFTFSEMSVIPNKEVL